MKAEQSVIVAIFEAVTLIVRVNVTVFEAVALVITINVTVLISGIGRKG